MNLPVEDRKDTPSAQQKAVPIGVKRNILNKAFLTRTLEERLFKLFGEGKLFGTIHTCIGQELSGSVITEFLQPGDSIFSNHRCHGHFISFTHDAEGLIAEIMGKETGVCGGRGGSQHLCKDGFYSNGIQGGIVPITTGQALARKLSKSEKISVVFIGDGTLGEGAVYESLNIASKWGLPILIVLENNGYAQSTNQKETLAGNICARAESFGIRSAQSDTWNWESLYSVAEDLVNMVRHESKPAFLQVDTYRLRAHSKGDDDRDPTEIAAYLKKDPLNRLQEENEREYTAYVETANKIVDDAVVVAERAPFATLGIAPPENKGELQWSGVQLIKRRFVTAINETFKDLITRYPKMVFIGEDIRSPYGGAFKVTQGLSDMYPDRVFNTPISEAAIVGIGCGLALEGYVPIVEIMFGDFMTLALDQILNNASKFRYMYNEQVSVGLVIRTPMGGGRGYGPTHSQTLDRHFMGIPGLRIIALNNLIEPSAIYGRIVEKKDNVTLVIENKLLYGSFLRDQFPLGFNAFVSNEDFPTVILKPQAEKVDITLMGYGGLTEDMIAVADQLFEEHDLLVQIICPTQIYPFDMKPYIGLLCLSQHLVIVEEGQGFAGWGAEVIAQVAEASPSFQGKAKRIIPPVIPIPAARPLEKVILPGKELIIQSILEMIHEK